MPIAVVIPPTKVITSACDAFDEAIVLICTENGSGRIQCAATIDPDGLDSRLSLFVEVATGFSDFLAQRYARNNRFEGIADGRHSNSARCQ